MVLISNYFRFIACLAWFVGDIPVLEEARSERSLLTDYVKRVFTYNEIRLSGVILPVAALVVMGIYYLIDPVGYEWMPKCPLLLLSGYECPACGVQRAFHAALHLRFAEALAYNLFLVISLPYLILAFYAFSLKGPGSGWLRYTLFSHAGVLCYLVLWFAWWIIRNLM